MFLGFDGFRFGWFYLRMVEWFLVLRVLFKTGFTVLGLDVLMVLGFNGFI